MPKTIAIDFDGVLHGYSKKWSDGTIYDVPIPDSKEAMQELLDLGFETVIYSTRCSDRTVNGKTSKNQLNEMKEWLDKYEIPYTRIHDEPGKPLCMLLIDDNAYRFDGNWEKCLIDIKKILGK